jgi:hypothetical protein
MDGIDSNRVGMLTIEWEMMNKKRFFILSAINSLGLRCVLYPLTVIKTRLQVVYTTSPLYDLLLNTIVSNRSKDTDSSTEVLTNWCQILTVFKCELH